MPASAAVFVSLVTGDPPNPTTSAVFRMDKRFLLGGFVVGLLGFREMSRAGTNVDPYRPATTVVTGGPYRFTRNPMYVGFTLMYVGISAWTNALLPILLLPAVQQLMRRGVIEREERYLERKFGDDYLRYKARVRRWI